MKKIIFMLALVTSSLAFACIDIGNELKICPNDVVFKGDYYIEGARVVAVNPRRQKVTVKSISSGMLHVEAPDDLDIIDRCLEFDFER